MDTFCHGEHSRTIDKNTCTQFYATDISDSALKIAKQNAKENKTKIKFLKGNLLEPLDQPPTTNHQPLILTANLPYLTTKELQNPQLKYEPKLALDGGSYGLKYFREFFNQIKQYNLKPKAIFLEIGHNQAAQIKKLAKNVLPAYKIKIKKDLCGFDRVIIITA